MVEEMFIGGGKIGATGKNEEEAAKKLEKELKKYKNRFPTDGKVPKTFLENSDGTITAKEL